MTHRSHQTTSWHQIGSWYNEKVGEKGHYYHQSVILPGVLRLLDLKEEASVLDIACGQGILSRQLPPVIPYVGIDIAKSLILSARQYNQSAAHEYFVGDATQKLPITKKDFSHAVIILALQNIEDPLKVFKNVSHHLKPKGRFVIVLNHPCFRIPRQSSWGVDPNNKMQYRRIDRYMSALKIPIQTHPGKGESSPQSWTFHHPLSSYTQWLKESGFTMLCMEEWCSDKVSTGKAAKMENRSREEFPLFMTILAEKIG